MSSERRRKRALPFSTPQSEELSNVWKTSWSARDGQTTRDHTSMLSVQMAWGTPRLRSCRRVAGLHRTDPCGIREEERQQATGVGARGGGHPGADGLRGQLAPHPAVEHAVVVPHLPEQHRQHVVQGMAGRIER